MRLSRRELLLTGLAAGLAATSPCPPARASAARQAASPVPVALSDEDGYDLSLRYRPVVEADLFAHYRAATARIVRLSSGPLAQSITGELDRACQSMLNHRPTGAESVTANGAVLTGTPNASPAVRAAIDPSRLSALGDEGFILRAALINGDTAIVIAANPSMSAPAELAGDGSWEEVTVT